jgi:hypothetical protein
MTPEATAPPLRPFVCACGLAGYESVGCLAPGLCPLCTQRRIDGLVRVAREQERLGQAMVGAGVLLHGMVELGARPEKIAELFGGDPIELARAAGKASEQDYRAARAAALAHLMRVETAIWGRN